MKIRELPVDNRPREKAIRYGIDSLSNTELLAIIIGSGTKDTNVLQLATNLLSEYGSIHAIFSLSYHDLIKVKGIKEAKALMLASIGQLFARMEIEENDEILTINSFIKKYYLQLNNEKQEKIILIPAKQNHRPITEKLLYIGLEKEVSISFKDIFREVLKCNVCHYYLIHLHPNNLSLPSKEDIYTIKKLKKSGEKVGIYLIDAYIIGTDGETSINEYLAM